MPVALMQLTAFRVTNCRSVRDSGWVEASEITALIGTNESGKTNLLLTLWKLNPAKEGEIKLLSDAPRKDYNAYRTMSEKPVFIQARFMLSEALAANVASLTGKTADDVRRVEVSRDFAGDRRVHFPDAQADNRIDAEVLRETLAAATEDITKASVSGKGKGNEALKAELLRRLREATGIAVGFEGLIGTDEDRTASGGSRCGGDQNRVCEIDSRAAVRATGGRARRVRRDVLEARPGRQ